MDVPLVRLRTSVRGAKDGFTFTHPFFPGHARDTISDMQPSGSSSSMSRLLSLATARQSMGVREVKCGPLLHKFAYGASTGCTANLYKGCTHGCKYCYAPSLTHDGRSWGAVRGCKGQRSGRPRARAQGAEEGRSVPIQRVRPVSACRGQVQVDAKVPRGAAAAQIPRLDSDQVASGPEGPRPVEGVRAEQGGCR